MKSKQLKAIVFCSGTILMLVQLVSSRAIAPYLGTSVYTWTNVIGTTLLGILLGNYLGGLLSQRSKSKKVFGLSFIAAGISLVLSNFLLMIVDQLLGPVPMHIALKTAFYSFIVFFPPALLLSTILPQAFAFDVKDLKTTGARFGSLYAWSSIGNVFGLMTGGFLLIGILGTKQIMTVAALLMALLGLYIGRGHALWKSRITILVSLFFIGSAFLPSTCTLETNYYCIVVKSEHANEGYVTQTLKLDHLVHSYVVPEDPAVLGYGYEEVYANLIAAKFESNQKFNNLFIGGGGYVLPRYLEEFYPEAEIVVSEIDPEVTKINFTHLGLSTNTKIQTQNLDARRYLNQTDQKFDLVFGDAFNDFSVPFHLTTVEFHQLLKSRMNPNGVYALNIIDDEAHGKFMAAMIRTLRDVWNYVYLAPQSDDFVEGRNTYVLLATDEPIDEIAWEYAESYSYGISMTLDENEENTLKILSDDQVEAFLEDRPEQKLTDAFVPVDRYLAPLFRDAY